MVAFNKQNQGRLPERPSTSGGLVSKQRNINKRESRDDLYFNPPASHGKVTTFYNSPMLGSPLTPTASPKESFSHASSKSPSIRPFTPESLESKPSILAISMEVPRTEIGMALGSPAHPPIPLQQDMVAAQATSPSPDPSQSVTDDWNSSRASKPKSKGWKIFGGFFAGRKSTSGEAFYQLQPEGSVRTMVDLDGKLIDTVDPKPVKIRGRRRSMSGKKAKKDSRPGVNRTETAPLDFGFKDFDGRATPAPSIALDGNAIDVPQHLRKRGKSLLDVDIPDIRMERYSVMFGSLLGDSSISSQSLLERRQATLDKLKTEKGTLGIKEEEDETEKHAKTRRATSPQIRTGASPAFSLFPNTPSRNHHSPSPSRLRNSTLQRSNTSPAALSPSRPSFAPVLRNGGHSISISGNSNTNESNAPVALHISSLMRNDIDPLEEGCVVLATSEPIAEGIYDLASLPAAHKFAEPSLRSANSYHIRALEDSVAGSTASSTSSENSNSTNASSLITPESVGANISRPLNIASPLEIANSTAASSLITPKSAGTNISRPLNIASPMEIANSMNASSLITPKSAGTNIFRPLNIASPPLTSISRVNRQTGPIGEIPKPRSRSATRIANAAAGRSRSTSVSNREEEENSEDEHETRIITADVSIARQISVSRQQRQLLVPIKTNSVRRNAQPQKKTLGLGITNVNVAHVASPLAAVASAAQAERERTISPLAESRDRFPTPIRKQSYHREMQGTERLVESTANPSTPTLVIVGDAGMDEREQRWATATANLKGSIAERRKIRKGLAPVTGEMRGRLASASAVRGSALDRPTGHIPRRSEDVVVEQVN